MPIDEATAYALAAWERLDHDIGEELVRAVCGAFAVVAVADGDLDERETERFITSIVEHFSSTPRFDLDEVERRFRDLTQAILTDPVAGRAKALEEVACVRGNPDHCEIVFSFARAAMMADMKIDPAEAQVLDEITRTLE